MKLDKTATEDDMLAQFEEAQQDFAAAQIDEHRDEIEAFKVFAASKGFYLTNKDFSYIPTTGVVASAPRLLESLVDGIVQERDGVISFSELSSNFKVNALQPGYFRADNFMIMAHPYFRRGMHSVNNFAPRFVELIWGFESDKVTKYIAIDEDRIRINVDDGFYDEFDTWYGPLFSDDISKIQCGVVKLRPPIDLKPEHVSFFFADIYCMDIKWSQKGRIKTFQALEIKSEKFFLVIDDKKFYPARYVHAEYDMDKGFFRHFDGAVQFFTENEYEQRRDSNFNYNLKSKDRIKACSKKMFKFNGKLRKEHWVEFWSHFFSGNPLVFEYITGNYPSHISEAVNRLREHAT